MTNRRLKAATVFSATLLVLTVSFYSNAFSVARDDLFAMELTESHVVGRMVKSRQDGILSEGGLLGYGGLGREAPEYTEATLALQYTAYAEGLEFSSYVPYRSQVGGPQELKVVF